MGRGFATWVVLAAIAAPALGQGGPGEIRQQVSELSLDAEKMRPVGRLRIDAGPAIIELQGGVIFPTTAVSGRVVEMVYIGRGTFNLVPGNRVESEQLLLYAGDPGLEEQFTEAVLVVANDAAAEALLREPVAEASLANERRRAESIYETWKSGPVRKGLGVDRAILIDAVERGQFDGYFAASFNGRVLDEFYYAVDPDEVEQVTVGQFVPLEAERWEQRRISRDLRRQQRKGRLQDLEVADIGYWDTWVSTPLTGERGTPQPGQAPFAPKHYVMDVTIDRGRHELSNQAEILMTAVTGGRRVVRLSLSRDITIDGIRLESDGETLMFHRAGTDLIVVLPSAPAAGETFRVVIDYSGRIIEEVGKASLSLRSTTSWYPNTGDWNRATYDVKFHYPKGLKLLGSGRVVENGREEGGRSWERRVIELPVHRFTFEIGQFEILRGTAGHVELVVGLDPDTRMDKAMRRDEILQTIGDALTYYEQEFGPYPLDYLTVATVPRGFSQGMLSFLTIAKGVLSGEDWLREFFSISDPRTILAHEVAHQWWGNLIGWESYRDQWISEAMANYSTAKFARDRLDWKGRLRISPTGSWSASLGRHTRRGLPVDAMGPVTLGTRLANSSLDREPEYMQEHTEPAYSAIVYKKGAVVLDTLSRSFSGEGIFDDFLRKLVERSSLTNISTEDFVAALAEHTGVELGSFVANFIHGCGIPEVYYSYAIDPVDQGNWIIRGEAELVVPYRYDYRVARTDDGLYDVRREGSDLMRAEETFFPAPMQIVIARPGEEPGMILGRVMIQGRFTEFEFSVPHEPTSLWLDRDSEVYALFYDEARAPKKVLYYRALGLAASGHVEQAEAMFNRALAADLHGKRHRTDPKTNTRQAQRVERTILDSQIHLNLARLYLDQDRIEDARVHLAGAGTTHPVARPALEKYLLVMNARMHLRQGEPKKALGQLSKHLFADHIENRLFDAEGYGLLAIAAKQTGDDATYGKAYKLAERFGVDMSVLDSREE